MLREQYGEYAFLCLSVKGLQVFSLPVMYTFIYFDDIQNKWTSYLHDPLPEKY